VKWFAALLLAAAAAPSPEIRYFQFQRSVPIPESASGQTCAVLDVQTFTHASPGLVDLRLYRGRVESPYVIRDALPDRAPAPSIEPMNLGRRRGRTVFDATMPDGPYSDLQLMVTGQNFLATVAVSGSQTETGPATHIGSYTIFDFASQRLGRSTVVHLPKSNFRFLHFEIAGPIGPEHITGLVAAPQPQGEPRYITVTDQVHFTQKGRDSVAEFTTPQRVPVDRILFTPNATPVNFNRRVDVQVSSSPSKVDDSAQQSEPTVAAMSDLLRIHRLQDGHHIDEERLAIVTSEPYFNAARKWTITLENGDDQPIQFSSVRVEMLERDLCFESAAATEYTLYYGDQALFAPRYDYAAWSAPQADLPSTALAPEQLNPSYEQRPDIRPFTEKHPSLLWIALVAVVVLLGAIALRTAKRIESPAPMP
jgi:hypothetical protein